MSNIHPIPLSLRTSSWLLRSGSVPGHAHTRVRWNNQDCSQQAAWQFGGGEYLLGVVCDGCTGGKVGVTRSEVGAILSADFIVSEAPLIVSSGVALSEVPAQLYQRLVGYLSTVARGAAVGGLEVITDFVARKLLATVIGFIVGPEETVVFRAGDGVIDLNGQTTVFDEKNKPSYPAYHLIDRAFLGGFSPPAGFESDVIKTEGIQSLAICSDGIVPLVKSGRQAEAFALDEPAGAGIKWALNGLANDGAFEDDCTVVRIHRLASETAKEGGGL